MKIKLKELFRKKEDDLDLDLDEELNDPDIRIETSSGRDFPDDLSPYALVIHCGGCMLNGREVQYRMKCAADQAVPITNYGIAIAYMQGILKRSLSVFPYLQSLV